MMDWQKIIKSALGLLGGGASGWGLALQAGVAILSLFGAWYVSKKLRAIYQEFLNWREIERGKQAREEAQKKRQELDDDLNRVPRPGDDDVMGMMLPPESRHLKPGTNVQCNYMALIACNKCGWVKPMHGEN